MQNFFGSGKINTTRTKAKFISPLIERCVSRAKKGGLGNVRHLIGLIGENLTNKLIHEIAPSFTRNSGFTRIIPLGYRKGDNTQIVRLELLEKDIEIVKQDLKNEDSKEVSKPKSIKKSAVEKKSKTDKITTDTKKTTKKEIKKTQSKK